MALRKRKIIDRTFQLKTIFAIIGIALCSFLVLIAFVAVQTTHDTRKITNAVADVHRAMEQDDRIVNEFVQQLHAGGGRTQVQKSAAFLKTHNKIMRSVRNTAENLSDQTRNNLLFISIVVLLVVLLSASLFIYLLRLTHRIAGPVYVMSRHIRDILENRKPEIRELRDKDELRDFYVEFVALVEKFTHNEK